MEEEINGNTNNNDNNENSVGCLRTYTKTYAELEAVLKHYL